MNPAGRLEIGAGLLGELERHVAASDPEECCGILLGRRASARTRVEAVRHSRNVATDRRRSYVIDPADLAAAQREARRTGLGLVGYYHSHPRGGVEPSAADLEHAWPEMTYLILGGGAGMSARAWYLAGAGDAFLSQELEVTAP